MIERNLHDVIENEFNRGVDPYGKPWSPLKPSTLRKGRKPPPLTGPTRRLRGDIVIHADSAQVFVHIPAEYTTHHQFGAPSVNLAQREMVPTSGPSASWNKAITDAIDKAAEKNSR
jgi:phage gpG-like protein